MKNNQEGALKKSYESDGKMGKKLINRDDKKKLKEAEFFNITPESE